MSSYWKAMVLLQALALAIAGANAYIVQKQIYQARVDLANTALSLVRLKQEINQCNATCYPRPR